MSQTNLCYYVKNRNIKQIRAYLNDSKVDLDELYTMMYKILDIANNLLLPIEIPGYEITSEEINMIDRLFTIVNDDVMVAESIPELYYIGKI